MNLRLAATVLALWALPVGAAGIPEVQRNLNPVLDTASAPLAGAALTVGHATFTFKEGSAALFRAGGEPAGIFFKGKGTLQYLSADPEEWPVMSYNLAQNSKVKPVKTSQGLSFTLEFSEALVWTRNLALPTLGAAAGPDLSPDFKANQAWFHPQGQCDPAGLLALAGFDRPDAAVLQAQVRNADEAIRYLYSGKLVERVEAVHQGSSRGDDPFQEAVLSEQCLGWSRRAPLQDPWALVDVDLDLATADNRNATLRTRQTFIATEPGQRLMRLDLESGKWHQPAGLGTPEFRKVNLASVKDEAGHDLPFEHRDGELLVLLPAAPAPFAPFRLAFEINGPFLIPHGGDAYWELGVESWFPQPGFSGMDYTVHARAKVPKAYTLLMAGDTVKRSEEDGCTVVETRFDQPVCFYVIAAGKYTTKEETRNGRTVRIAGYSGLGSSSDTLIKLAFEIIGYYETILGPYPFKEFNIVERNELGHGQAPPGYMFITQEAFNPIKDTINRMVASMGINQMFAHEIAHQWWGTKVKMWSVEDQWITESFAEYCSGLAILHMKGKGQDEFDALKNRWKESAKASTRTSSIALANRVRPHGANAMFEFMTLRQNLIYFKGAHLLATLHKELGDAAFYKFLWLYVHNLEWKISRTSDISDFLKYVTRKDYTKFLDDYYWGTQMP